MAMVLKGVQAHRIRRAQVTGGQRAHVVVMSGGGTVFDRGNLIEWLDDGFDVKPLDNRCRTPRARMSTCWTNGTSGNSHLTIAAKLYERAGQAAGQVGSRAQRRFNRRETLPRARTINVKSLDSEGITSGDCRFL